MKITQEMLDDAKERAEKAIEYLDEDARWGLLRERIEREQEAQMEAALRLLEMEALRNLVCPNVERKDWSGVLGGREPLDRWLHRVRMAHALGIAKGKL